MLMTERVFTKWNVNNKKHYENKGYIFTKWNDEFEVKVEDLTKSSHIGVQVKCDCAECVTPITKPVKWGDYVKHVHDDGKYYCVKCVKKIYSTAKHIKTKIENGESFEKWCINNNRQDILDRWDYELNELLPDDINHGTGEKHWFKCLKHPEHKSELKSLNCFTNGQEGAIKCKQCNSFAQWGYDNIDDDFLNKYWNYAKNDGINPWKISKCSNKEVYILCQEKLHHENNYIQCNSFHNGIRCGYCSGARVHPLDSLGQYIIDKFGVKFLVKVWSDKNIKSPFEYTPFSTKKIYWNCIDEIHEDYLRIISESTTREFRCSKCVQLRRESILQEKARLYFNELGYKLLHEYDCNILPINPKYKGSTGSMPYDNEIEELSLICEVHGSQHYKSCTWHILTAKHNNTTPEYELHMQKVRDRYKKFISYKNKYNYLEIPYWTDNKQEEWKQLIDDKIKEIKLNNNIKPKINICAY